MRAIMSQEYLAMIEDRVSDEYYKNVSGELEFKNYCPDNNNFAVVCMGSCNIIVPTSGVIFL